MSQLPINTPITVIYLQGWVLPGLTVSVSELFPAKDE